MLPAISLNKECPPPHPIKPSATAVHLPEGIQDGEKQDTAPKSLRCISKE